MTRSSKSSPPSSTDVLQRLVEQARAEKASRHARALEGDLHAFVRYAWQVLEPHTPFIDNWHIALLCKYLTRVTNGEISRLVINIPPGTSKSRIVTVMWPVWEWITRPWLRYMCWSYAKELSTAHSMERRTLVESDWFQERWGDRVQLKHDHNLKSEIASTSLPGMMTATAVGSAATGKGGERLIIDDPLNPKQAASLADLAAVTLFWTQTLPTRLRNQDIGAIVLVMQRLAQGDPTDLAIGEDYEHLCLPMEYEPDHPYVHPEDPRTEEGELLCPKRYSRVAVEALKISLGSYGTAGQLQQRPAPKGGGIVQTAWWRWYTIEALPGTFDELIQSWDCSFKKTTDGSFVVGQVWGRRGAAIYLLDQVRFRGGFVDLKKAITGMSAKWARCFRKLIEAKANGPAVIDDLKATVPGLLPVETGALDKEARLQAVAPMIESGNVFLPSQDIYPWIRDYINEFENFPKGPNDDQVDATSQALQYLGQKSQEGLRSMLRKAMAKNRGRLPGRR